MAGYTDFRFLVVDDMLTMRKILSKFLTTMGITQIQEARDGAEGWAMAQKEAEGNKPFQAILTDLNMPEMDGVGLVKNLRSHPGYKDAMLLVVTSEMDGKRLDEALQGGADGYLFKPPKPEELKEKLDLAFSKRNAK